MLSLIGICLLGCAFISQAQWQTPMAHLFAWGSALAKPLVTAQGPSQSSSIALSTDNQLLFNVNPEANSVSVFNASVTPPTKLAEVAVGRDPLSVANQPNFAKAYVANAADGTVSVINFGNFAVLSTFNVGAEPQALAVSPNGTRLYVANSASNNLMVFNATSLPPTFVTTIDLSSFGTAPRAIAITNNGDGSDTDETIFVALFYGQLRTGKTAVDEGQDDQREGRVVAISAATNTVLGPVILGPQANTGFNSNGKLAPGPGQMPAVASINPQTAFTTPTGAFPNQLAAIALHPSQPLAYVVSTGASPNGPLRFNQMAQGLVSVFNTGARAEVTAAQTDPNLRRTAPLNLNQGINLSTTPAPKIFMTNPVAMAWRPDGSDAWAVIQNSDLVTRVTIDGGGIPTIGAPLGAGPSQIVRVDLQSTTGAQIPGKAPRGITINNVGTRAYVANFISRSISVIDISNPTPTVIGTASSTALPTPGSIEATALLGGELFYTGRGPQDRMSSESWGGCIVCHPHGRSDNVTWMFDAGPRQTIPLDGTFNKQNLSDQRLLNWSAVRDENHDFELNTRGVFGGRGLIDDDRLFLAIGGAAGGTPTDTTLVEQFQQATFAVSTTNDLSAGAALPALLGARRDFGVATLDDDRVYIIGGRTGAGQGALITGANAILEFNPRTNTLTPKSSTGFTPRHSLGAAAVKTSQGLRIYAVGGYSSTSAAVNPVNTVEEYNPVANTWRTVAGMPTAIAQFGITVAGGINTAEPLQLIHAVSGNTGSESTPALTNPNPVQRFQADPAGSGTWSAFNPAGLTLRRNHGVATALRGAQSRIFIIGGQDAAGTVLDTVEEYLAQAVTAVATPHTSLPAPRASFGSGSTLTTNQIYVIGGVDGTGADQTTIFEYTIANNGPVAGPAGTPSGTWTTRGNLSVARRGLGVTTPPGVTNFLPNRNTNRDARQDAIAVWVARKVRTARPPVSANDAGAVIGKQLFEQVGLVQAGFSCATCHGGPKFTRSTVDYPTPPSADNVIGLGNERVIGAELRHTATQPNTQAAGTPPQFPGVLLNVGTFTLAGGRTNEIRFNGADISQAINPLGANGFNIPSLLSLHETGPYYYNGLAQTLDQVLDGSQDGNGGTRHHFVTNATDRTNLVQYLKSIDRTCGTLTFAPNTLPTGTVGVPYPATQLTAAGGLEPFTFQVLAGSVPPGLTLSASGLLSGTPTARFNVNLTIEATDFSGCKGTRTYVLDIGCQPITINPATLPNGVIGTPYNQTFTATGATGTVTWNFSGSLPVGLSLNATTGQLSGSPTTSGTFNFTIIVTDASNCLDLRFYTVIISGLQFYALAAPVRLLDTRGNAVSPNACTVNGSQPIGTGGTVLQTGRGICTIPANAQALTGNVTTVVPAVGGFLTLYPSGAAQPTVASTNYDPNSVINNVFTVGLGGSDGKFNIFASSTTHVVVDVTGYYAPPGTGGLFFHPLPAPVRLLETRPGQPVGCIRPGVPLVGGADSLQTATTACTGIPAAARSVVGNATTVSPAGIGYLTLYPADVATAPLVASSNYTTNQIVNGPFTVGLSPAGQFKIFTTQTTHLVVDVLGYYSPEAVDANGAGLLFTPLAHPVRLLETRNQPVGCFKPGAPLNGGQVYTQVARGLCDSLTIPAAALAVVGNATVVFPVSGGYLTLWPSGASQPTAATSNYNTNDVVNRHFIVGLGSGDGAFKMFSQATTELVIDLSGYFAP